MKNYAEVFSTKPLDFNPKHFVVGCYIIYDDRLLLVRRAKEDLFADTWCVPGGKIEPGENTLQATVREIQEEIGLTIDPSQLMPVKRLYIKKPQYHLEFNIFQHLPSTHPSLTLSPEHTAYTWVTYQEALALPLVPGGLDALHYYLAAYPHSLRDFCRLSGKEALKPL